MGIQYTQAEKTERKYLPSFALAQARAILKGQSVCVNAMNKYQDDDLLTLEQVNDLVSEMVGDSCYHNN